MKTIIVLAAVCLIAWPVQAGRYRMSSDDTYVEGYTRQNGTYVQPYYRSAPNAYQWDNYNYQPSQPAYNQPTEVQHNSDWYQPNQGRFFDNNRYNNNPWQ